jgi:hypothetical protein
VHRCLEVDPGDRFSSISELVSALAPFCPTFADRTVSRIQRRLDARSSGEVLRGSDEAPVDPRAPTEPVFDDEAAKSVRTYRRWRARRVVSHTAGWLAVGGMLLLLAHAYAPTLVPTSGEVITEARGTVERVTEAARTAWERASDAPAR